MIEADTFEHAGLTIRIAYEEYVDENDNPRTNQDGNIGVMFCEHSRYDLGDTNAEDPREHEIECDQCKGTGEHLFEIVDRRAYGREIVEDNFPSLAAAEEAMEREPHDENARLYVGPSDCEKCDGTGEVEVSIIDYLKSIGCRVALPLFLYDHSGLAMSCGANLLAGEDNFDRHGRFLGDDAGWDTSSVGLIYHLPELCERWGRPDSDDAKIEKELRQEVHEYDAYLRGNVFWFEVLDAVEDEGVILEASTREELDSLDDAEVLDTCSGFLEPDFDDSSYIYEAARNAAECAASAIESEKRAAQEWAARGVVTVG